MHFRFPIPGRCLLLSPTWPFAFQTPSGGQVHMPLDHRLEHVYHAAGNCAFTGWACLHMPYFDSKSHIRFFSPCTHTELHTHCGLPRSGFQLSSQALGKFTIFCHHPKPAETNSSLSLTYNMSKLNLLSVFLIIP